MRLKDLVKNLDSLFNIEAFEKVDNSLNGLQVGSDFEVESVYLAVDASMDAIKKASPNSLLVVHHGIFWNKKERIVREVYAKIEYLIKNNIALYVLHLPMDAHEKYSHSLNLALFLGLEKIEFCFDNYGVIGNFNGNFQEILLKIEGKTKPLFSAKFKENVRKVAIASGGGGFLFKKALEKEVDLFITGDSFHQIYGVAKENAINLIFAGHYFTEVFGLLALKNYFQDYNLEAQFIWDSTGL